jgi:protein required for attachment to host cells
VRKTWIVVADRSRARIFSVETPKGPLIELADLVHPEARAHERDLTSDRPGRSRDQHVLSPPHSARDQQAQGFAREIADELEDGRHNARFEQLLVVAAPDILGMLRKTMSTSVAKTVTLEIDKNMTQHDPADIRKLLPTFIR